MGHKVKQALMSSRIDFFYYAFRNILLVSVPLLIVSSVVLSHLSFHSSAAGSSSGVDQIQFSLSSSCTMSSVVDEAHTKEINNGTYHSDVGKTTITTLCNDGNGYSVYAAGYSNNEEGNTKLINVEHPEYSIDTGLATSGLTSQWAMKLNNIPDDPSPTPPVIEPAYDNTYGLVPQYWTRVASRPSGTTDMDEGSSFATTYAIYTTSNQHAGTYNGQVKYVLTHPSTQPYVYYMQEVDKWKNTIALEESVQAIDMRDGKKYWVTKLKDGNIWMTQNLDLDIGGANTAPLNSNNTDISTTASGSGIYVDGYAEKDGVWTWNPTSTALTSNRIVNFNNNTVSGGWSDNNTMPHSAEGGDTYLYTSGSNASDIRYNSMSECTTAGHMTSDCQHYHVGNYYNWPAAIVSNNSTDISTNYDRAANSICPKGWRLPIATNSDQSIYEFGNLLYDYNIISTKTSTSYTANGLYNIRKVPTWLVRGGGLSSGQIWSPMEAGSYWSSVVSNNGKRYILEFSRSTIYVSSYAYTAGAGFSIRCLAR